MKLLLALTLALGGPLPGQGTEEPAQASLYARGSAEDVRVAIEIEIEPGWHLYHGPTREDLGPPEAVGKETTVALDDRFEWSAVRFPKPERAEQDFGDGPTYLFQHEGTIVLYARGRAKTPGVDLTQLAADVDGLGCTDEGVCIPYSQSLVSQGAGSDALFAAFPSDLAIGAAASAPANGAASATGPPEASGASAGRAPGVEAGAGTSKPVSGPATASPGAAGEDAAPGAELGLLAFLLSAVWWGFFTLLMPCTYPMIPITISYFTKQAAQRKSSVLPLSLSYGAGIVLIFVAIGVSIGPLIIPFATHPITNLVIGGFFLLFALALFGMIDLQPPAFLMNAAGKASMKGGYAGVFLMGATLVVTSFTCTAPFVGTLLSAGASSGDLGRVALGMGVFGLTIAVPFVFLSLVPDRVKTMPKSGEWMHVLKVTLGFVEVAAALKFLSNVDLVWGWGWLSRELFLFLWMGIFVVTALYLFGLVHLDGESRRDISPGRMVAALSFFLFSIYCGYGALGNSLDPIMTALAPPYSNRSVVAAVPSGDRGAAVATGPVIVKDDYAAARERARVEGKGLLVNFTGFT